MQLLQSATKFVLLALILALIVFTGLKIVTAEQFMNIVVAVVSFYFGQKQGAIKTNPTE